MVYDVQLFKSYCNMCCKLHNARYEALFGLPYMCSVECFDVPTHYDCVYTNAVLISLRY